jgi:hypothetical protein
MRFRDFLSASAVAALFGSLAITPLAAQDCSGDYEYVEQDCAGSSPGWFGQRPIRVKVVVRRPKFLMAPLAPAAPAGYALPAPAAAAPAAAPAYAAPAMAMPMFTMMAAPAMAAPAYYQPTAAPAAAAPAPASAAPGLSDDQLRKLAELLAAAAAAPAKPATAAAATCAPAAASAGLFRNCSESSGEIQQLRRDVDDLIKVTNRLTAVVEKLAENHIPKN